MMTSDIKYPGFPSISYVIKRIWKPVQFFGPWSGFSVHIFLSGLGIYARHDLLIVKYYSKILDNRFWYPVGY